MGSGLILKKGR